MIKTGCMFAICLMLLVHTKVRDVSAQTPTHKLFLLEDDTRKEWCVYANESQWKSQVASSGAARVATMYYSDARLTSVDITTEDETGDWIVFDHYALSATGDIQQVQRKVNILPGDRSVSETFLVLDGKAKLQTRTTTSLSAGDKLTDAEHWLPRVRVVTRLKNFPFVSLTTVKYSDVLSKGKTCAAVSTDASKFSP